MALIKCPECGKEVSDRADVCIHCGFPLNKVDNIDLQQYINNIESQLHRLKNALSQKYGETEIYQTIKENMIAINNNTSNPSELYDNLVLTIATNLSRNNLYLSWATCKRYFELVNFNYITENGFQELADKLKSQLIMTSGDIMYWYPIYQVLNYAPENCINELIDSLQKPDAFGKPKIDFINSFAKDHLNDDVTVIKETPPVKCPTCHSTNVNKISTAKKAVGFATVGVFSSNFGKTMECKNCGYKW